MDVDRAGDLGVNRLGDRVGKLRKLDTGSKSDLNVSMVEKSPPLFNLVFKRAIKTLKDSCRGIPDIAERGLRFPAGACSLAAMPDYFL